MSNSGRVDGDELDPDIRRFVRTMQESYAQWPSFESLSLAERRSVAEKVRAPWRAGGPKMQRTLETTICGVRARIHFPVEGRSLGAMLYLHGGGWTMFSIDTHDRLMREYAMRSGIVVAGIDYSLSPEAKFPVALEEAVAAIGWLSREGAALGIDPERLAIGGDSAGANLAVATALKLRAAGHPKLRAMLLNYGAFSPQPTPSFERYGGPAYMLTPEEMQVFWTNYTSSPSELDDPLVAPLSAHLGGLPPAFFCVGACDILVDSNRAMAARCAAAGVPCEEHVYPGATHSFLEAVSIAPLADHALTEASAWLRAHLDAGAA